MESTASVSQYDDPRRPLLRAVRFGSIALVAITVISLVLWGALRDLPGIWGVLIGAAIGGGFVLLTALSVLMTSSTSAATTGAVVLGSWLLKIVVLLVVLFVLRDMTFYDRTALFVTTVIALIVVLGTEVWGVITARVTYVN
ncbi:hypothetical protein CATRI_05260 [Corynebacterium atrinae]|uniref:ATP synthase I chain n=1 Tax=Corynebacterium testudinoris TaxID=136857 RepID=A0A0G3HBF7_9CORY|nr:MULTISPECIES: hypothetical protein [Corynebacterium]AKK08512.1 hypothetical protein CTEST_05330 [Corynebacterium testudinoris]MBX8994722.1 hypothetical protein [Corynebacterium testudinoris]WJY63144.1 hypothetical protein CATRI_05260 [Corynebacterium atrinae]